MAVAVPADKRFRRAHVRPARRRRLWEGRGWRVARGAAVLLLAAYALAQGMSLLLTAPTLQVSRIAISGNERLSRGEVLALLDGLQGQSMVTVRLDAWRARLMKSPWVADAALRRLLPGTVAVALAERQPMGIARLRGELYLVDRGGTVIDEYGPNYADLDLPIIDGLAATAALGGLLIDEPRAALAARLLEALGARRGLARRVSQIDVSDARDAVVILEGDTTLVRLGDEQFAERLQTYVDLAAALRDRVPEIDYVDMRFDERFYVRPLAGALPARLAAAAPAPGRARGAQTRAARPRKRP